MQFSGGGSISQLTHAGPGTIFCIISASALQHKLKNFEHEAGSPRDFEGFAGQLAARPASAASIFDWLSQAL